MGHGLTLNCAITQENGEYNIGAHYQDTDGIDINFDDNGKDIEKMINKCFAAMFSDYAKQTKQLREQAKAEQEEPKITEPDAEYVASLEQMIAELRKENQSLKADNTILQRRADDAVNTRSYSDYNKYINDLFEGLFK